MHSLRRLYMGVPRCSPHSLPRPLGHALPHEEEVFRKGSGTSVRLLRQRKILRRGLVISGTKFSTKANDGADCLVDSGFIAGPVITFAAVSKGFSKGISGPKKKLKTSLERNCHRLPVVIVANGFDRFPKKVDNKCNFVDIPNWPKCA